MKEISFPKFQFKKPDNKKCDRRCIIQGLIKDYYCAAPVKIDAYAEPQNKETFINIGVGRIYSIGGIKFHSTTVLSFFILNPSRPTEKIIREYFA